MRYGQIYSNQQANQETTEGVDSKHRNTWNGLNPVTRTVPNGKGYDRNKQKQQDRRSGRLSYNQDSTCRFCYA